MVMKNRQKENQYEVKNWYEHQCKKNQQFQLYPYQSSFIKESIKQQDDQWMNGQMQQQQKIADN